MRHAPDMGTAGKDSEETDWWVVQFKAGTRRSGPAGIRLWLETEACRTATIPRCRNKWGNIVAKRPPGLVQTRCAKYCDIAALHKSQGRCAVAEPRGAGQLVLGPKASDFRCETP